MGEESGEGDVDAINIISTFLINKMLNLNPKFPSRMSQCRRKHQSLNLKKPRNLHFQQNLPRFTQQRDQP